MKLLAPPPVKCLHLIRVNVGDWNSFEHLEHSDVPCNKNFICVRAFFGYMRDSSADVQLIECKLMQSQLMASNNICGNYLGDECP
jgi:hypothetical protein